MARPSHAAQRQVQALTLGVAKSRERLRRYEAEVGFSEGSQQYQFHVSGFVGPIPAFSTKELTFDYPFYYAPGQRDSDLEKPQIRTGFVSEDNIMLTVGVKTWTINADTGGIIGAILNVGVIAGTSIACSALAHVEFQGFYAPDDHADDEVA